MMRRTAIVRGAMTLAVAALGLSGGALASERGSMEDQMACTPDVYRLCSSFVPDEDAIVGCLKRNVSNLSPACQKVFSSPDSPSTANGEENGDE